MGSRRDIEKAAARKRSRLMRALPYLGIVLGLLIIGFYPASEAIDAWRRSRIAVSLDQTASTIDTSQRDELLEQARAYNQALAGEDPELPAEQILPYEQQLSLTGADTPFAYLSIPAIDLTMPVYHGTDEAALSAGVGHLQKTSLPVGGASTHVALSAHSGMSGMRAFDEIDQLEVGDVFGVKVLGELLCYRVYQSEVVLPDEASSLDIQPGRDLCTLVTCTPYGVNDHRLLVHGERCEVPEGFESSAAPSVAAVVTNKRVWPLLLAVTVVAAFGIAGFVVSRRRRASANEGKEEGNES